MLIGIVVALCAAAPASASGAAGALDRSFGGDGKVTTDFGGFDLALGVAVDPRDRVVTAGYSDDSSPRNRPTAFALARYRHDGRLDPSFGHGGKVTTRFGDDSYAGSVAIDSRGRIVAAGWSQAGNWNFEVARYASDGQPDPTFGVGGKVTTDLGATFDVANSVALDSHDRVIAAGYTDDIDGHPAFAIARYRDDGTLDPSFGSGGIVTSDFGHEGAAANSVAVDANDRVVAVGGSQGDFAVARYTPAGVPDASFAGTGELTTDLGSKGDEATSVAIDGAGRIVVGGSSGVGFALARYRPNGSLDSSLSGDGRLTAPLPEADQRNSIAVDSQGRIVAAGLGFRRGRSFDFALDRFGTMGTPDATFSGDGSLTTDFAGGSNDQAKAVAVDSHDRIIAVGGTDGVTATQPIDFAIARYLGEAPPSVRIMGRSRVKTRRRRARAHFELSADEPVTFHCRIDSRRFRRCSSPYRTPRLRAGKHRLKVRAVDEVGNRTTKVKRFEIVRRRR